MKRESISFERIDNRYKILKFSLPAVKEGTIIEYHYKLYSDYFIHIDNWMMQEELPMLYNQYKITIPNVFIYNIELRGKDYIQMKQKESALTQRHVKVERQESTKISLSWHKKRHSFLRTSQLSVRTNPIAGVRKIIKYK